MGVTDFSRTDPDIIRLLLAAAVRPVCLPLIDNGLRTPSVQGQSLHHMYANLKPSHFQNVENKNK